MFVLENRLLLCWGLFCASPPAASPPVVGGSRPYDDLFLLNCAPPRPLPPRILPRQRPPLAFDGRGIPSVAGVGIVGANFSVWGSVYGFVAPGLRYMLVGTGGGASNVVGSLHTGLATVGVVVMFASCCACCSTVVCRAVISCAMLAIFLLNSLVLALDACS